MAWARVIRGIASTAKEVTPPEASALVVVGGGQRLQEPDQDLAGADPADLLERRRRHPEDDVGTPGIADRGAGLGVLLVGMAGLDAGAGFDHDLEALADQRLDRVGDQRNSPLPLSRLFRDA